MPQKHGLGFGNGRFTEYEDGTVSYHATGKLMESFRVRISDVTGFSVAKGPGMMEQTVKLTGNGTELASVAVNYGTAKKIEEWFRGHPDFGGNSQTESIQPLAPGGSSGSVADELRKLADLRDEGVLSEEEFDAQKQALLGG